MLCFFVRIRGLEQHGHAAGGATKAPVGLLSGRAVLRQQDGGALPRQAPALSNRCVSKTLPEEKTCNESHNCKGAVRQKGNEHEVRCKNLPFQHGHQLRGTAAPGWEKNFHRLHRGRGCAGHYCFLTGDVQHLLFGVARSILMKSLYFYNFLYGSFIYSMLIFMHTDR